MADEKSATDQQNDETPDVVVEEQLVEEVSIDGMCGVY
jgi:mycofactocin precursor